PASMLSFAFCHGIGMFSQKRIDVQVIPLEGWTNIVSHFENEAILGDTDRAPHRLRPAHFPQCVEHTPFRLTVTQGRSLGEHVLCRAVRADHDIERDFAAEKFEAFTSGDEARLYGLERALERMDRFLLGQRAYLGGSAYVGSRVVVIVCRPSFGRGGFGRRTRTPATDGAQD